MTDVPVLNEATQVLPQLMPAGELATVPPPALVTARFCVGDTVAVTAAPTDCKALMVTEQLVDDPLQAPLQPLKA